jgi:putative DNA methylase
MKEKGLFYEHSSKSENALIQDVEKWSNWVLEEAKKIEEFYSLEKDGSISVGYI